VSYARLYRGAHHVSDVAWGIINGVVCALLAWNYLRREPAGASGTTGSASGETASGASPQTRA
jgi:PAP2 superfamily